MISKDSDQDRKLPFSFILFSLSLEFYGKGSSFGCNFLIKKR